MKRKSIVLLAATLFCTSQLLAQDTNDSTITALNHPVTIMDTVSVMDSTKQLDMGVLNSDSLPTMAAFSMLDDTVILKKNNLLYRFADASIYTIASPLRWKGKDWLNVGGVFAATALTTLADKPVRKFFAKQDDPFLDNLEQVGYHWGKPYAAMAVTGGVLATGFVLKNEWALETAAALGAAYATSGLVQTIMKTGIGRARPDMEEGNWSFHPMSKEPGYHSFPSGHIQMAMVTSMVMAERVNSGWLKGVLYGAAGVTFLSRLYVDAHWSSDLVFGTAISYFCTRAVLRRMDANKYKKEDNNKKYGFKMQFYPNLSIYSQGLTMIAKF